METEKPKILVVGCHGAGVTRMGLQREMLYQSALQRKENGEITTILDNGEFYICGVKYRKRTDKTRSCGLHISGIIEPLNFPELGSNSCSKAQPKRYSKEELIKEFCAVQNKKSKLSRAQRDYVENLFFNQYEIIK